MSETPAIGDSGFDPATGAAVSDAPAGQARASAPVPLRVLMERGKPLVIPPEAKAICRACADRACPNIGCTGCGGGVSVNIVAPCRLTPPRWVATPSAAPPGG